MFDDYGYDSYEPVDDWNEWETNECFHENNHDAHMEAVYAMGNMLHNGEATLEHFASGGVFVRGLDGTVWYETDNEDDIVFLESCSV